MGFPQQSKANSPTKHLSLENGGLGKVKSIVDKLVHTCDCYAGHKVGIETQPVTFGMYESRILRLF